MFTKWERLYPEREVMEYNKELKDRIMEKVRIRTNKDKTIGPSNDLIEEILESFLEPDFGEYKCPWCGKKTLKNEEDGFVCCSNCDTTVHHKKHVANMACYQEGWGEKNIKKDFEGMNE